MTIEEAIEYAEKKKIKLEEEIERHGSYYGAYAMYSTELEFVSMAISALRQQETGTNRNEPLTLDALREMDGEPVWVQSPGVPEYGRWAIVEGVGENCLFLHDDFTCHEYGKAWLAYRQKKEV